MCVVGGLELDGSVDHVVTFDELLLAGVGNGVIALIVWCVKFWSNWYINNRRLVFIITEHRIGPRTTKVLPLPIDITFPILNPHVHISRISIAHVTATPTIVLEGEVGVISTGKTTSLWVITVLLWSIVEIS